MTASARITLPRFPNALTGRHCRLQNTLHPKNLTIYVRYLYTRQNYPYFHAFQPHFHPFQPHFHPFQRHSSGILQPSLTRLGGLSRRSLYPCLHAHRVGGQRLPLWRSVSTRLWRSVSTRPTRPTRPSVVKKSTTPPRAQHRRTRLPAPPKPRRSAGILRQSSPACGCRSSAAWHARRPRRW